MFLERKPPSIRPLRSSAFRSIRQGRTLRAAPARASFFRTKLHSAFFYSKSFLPQLPEKRHLTGFIPKVKIQL